MREEWCDSLRELCVTEVRLIQFSYSERTTARMEVVSLYVMEVGCGSVREGGAVDSVTEVHVALDQSVYWLKSVRRIAVAAGSEVAVQEVQDAAENSKGRIFT